MGKFVANKTHIEGVLVIEPTVFSDNRGYFMESYNKNDFTQLGINCEFVQDNQSKSSKSVLRGMHFQRNYPQAKLVRIISGEVFDVVVDIRKGSKTYGNWFGEILSAENKKMLYVPKGFAHGFFVLSDEAEFLYKCDELYHSEDEEGLLWNDENIAIEWPLLNGKIQPILSNKDKDYSDFLEVKPVCINVD